MSELFKQDVVLVLYRVGDGDLLSTHIFDNRSSILDVQEYLQSFNDDEVVVLHIAR